MMSYGASHVGVVTIKNIIKMLRILVISVVGVPAPPPSFICVLAVIVVVPSPPVVTPVTRLLGVVTTMIIRSIIVFIIIIIIVGRALGLLLLQVELFLTMKAIAARYFMIVALLLVVLPSKVLRP